ncbi:hypothetical protein FDA33_06110 [Clostridium botulinum]|uniref:hypothetical protein n=1 Tax=Clostridium TaxID=1485 RepID=UPI000174E53D|nr:MULTISPECIES: hypothetical protein [Clostridium]ACD53237.1 hypothetical protein CLH_2098 [Clostridium botulinum E3 str. Alaska E43]MBY6816539.1 hypothetical protein [Clostridium botulinum]MBY6827206.1 hypothetical protein [Clostridium botulinum]MBY6859154.1 hypothetical protein [Clostridium botulinum]MBY7041562.1 hypothetical protein [Clostridium botulinum]
MKNNSIDEYFFKIQNELNKNPDNKLKKWKCAKCGFINETKIYILKEELIECKKCKTKNQVNLDENNNVQDVLV